MKRKKRDCNSKNDESFSEQHTPTEEANQQKPITGVERIADGSSRDDYDKRRKKNLEEENILGSGEIKKRKKAKDKVNPISNNTSDEGFDAVHKPAVMAEETVGDGNHKMRSSSLTRDEEKTRKQKKNKHRIAENQEFSVERISDKETTEEDKQTMDAGKISVASPNEGTSSARNADNISASKTSKTKKKEKKVSFSGNVEAFPSTSSAKSSDQSSGDGLLQGKRFSQEEDEMIRQAVFDYIKENQLGEDGLDMVLNCRSHRQAKGCWKEIGAALPWRPGQSIYYRAHTLFQRSEVRKWEPEEFDLVRSYHKEHGAKWKEMAELLGKHRVHVKDAWRRIKLPNAKKGKWSQEEYQTLFDLVNVDLQLKAFAEKKTKHGMLRENISWGAISKRMSTRYEMACCMKWYGQLTSPMVTQGLWADADDYRLIDGLLKLDACCIEDVDWDSLLDDRSGELCLKRWKQMARHIGGHTEKSFMEQVELLSSRYCPNMLQYRTQNLHKCDDNVNEAENSPV